MRKIRGNRIAMVFQEPMTSLNPLHTVGKQINEVLEIHKGLRGKAASARTLELLELVGIPEPRKRIRAYPHELSGGQRQRVMIAMALANEPELLIADEPTTALDVTVQLKILELLKELQARLGMALLLISHDLNLVRRVAHRVCVMQRGRVVEQALCEELFRSPKHPYTQELLAAEPSGGPVEVEQAAPLLEVEDLRVWFPIKKGLLRRTVDHIKAVDGVNFSLPRGRRWGSSAKAARASRPWGWLSFVCWPVAARSASRVSRCRACRSAPCGRCAGRCRWSSRTPTAA